MALGRLIYMKPQRFPSNRVLSKVIHVERRMLRQGWDGPNFSKVPPATPSQTLGKYGGRFIKVIVSSDGEGHVYLS